MKHTLLAALALLCLAAPDAAAEPVIGCRHHADCAQGKLCAPWATTGKLTCTDACFADPDCPAGFLCHREVESVKTGYCTLDPTQPTRLAPTPTVAPTPSDTPPAREPRATDEAPSPLLGYWHENSTAWVLMGAAGANAIAAAIFARNYAADKKDFEARNETNQGEFVSSKDTFAWATGIMAGALLLGSVIAFAMTATDDDPTAGESTNAGAVLQHIAPTALRDGAGLSMGFAF